MPDISTYIKVNDKNFKDSVVEINDTKPRRTCRGGVLLYILILLAWLVVGIYLFYITMVIRSPCNYTGYEEGWNNYKAKFGKNYSQEEDVMRMCTYLANKDEIFLHNYLFENGVVSYKKEINVFSDFTSDELDQMNGLRVDVEDLAAENAFPSIEDSLYPLSIDWRQKGAVGRVKNQGSSCGSCYAFSATGSLEAQHFRKTGRLVSLSEQNLVDCSQPQGNHGCSGGNMNNAFRYILQNSGIDTERAYPYEGKVGSCRFQRGAVGATLRGFKSVAPSEAALLAAVAEIGPVSIGIHVTRNFMQYQSGIFVDNTCDPYSLNHALLVVGYGSDGPGRDYWIVKNSWDTNWGENGYMRIARNRGNMCGIVSMASYPVV